MVIYGVVSSCVATWRAKPPVARCNVMACLDMTTHKLSSKCVGDVKVRGLHELVDMYDVFLLDQFGVIHDGTTAYDGAVDAVSRLQRAGKKLIIISNSSRRRGDTAARLLNMGIGPCQLESLPGESLAGADLSTIGVITSGDIVWEGLRERSVPPFDGLGIRCFVFGNGAGKWHVSDDDARSETHACPMSPCVLVVVAQMTRSTCARADSWSRL